MGFSEQVSIIRELLSSTGELEDVYVLPLIRCNENIACELNDDIYSRCITYFADDVRKYQFTDIMLLGEAARRFLNCNIKYNDTSIFISHNKRRYVVNYSPLTKYTNENLFNRFKDNLIKWYNLRDTEYKSYNIYFI